MRVGVVGTSFGNQGFRVHVAMGITDYPSGLDDFRGSLEELQALTDPSNKHYVIKRKGDRYALVRQETRRRQILIGYIEDAAATAA